MEFLKLSCDTAQHNNHFIWIYIIQKNLVSQVLVIVYIFTCNQRITKHRRKKSIVRVHEKRKYFIEQLLELTFKSESNAQ